MRKSKGKRGEAREDSRGLAMLREVGGSMILQWQTSACPALTQLGGTLAFDL